MSLPARQEPRLPGITQAFKSGSLVYPASPCSCLVPAHIKSVKQERRSRASGKVRSQRNPDIDPLRDPRGRHAQRHRRVKRSARDRPDRKCSDHDREADGQTIE